MLAKAFVDNAKVMAKGQVTIPKDVRDVLGVASGDRVTFVVEGNTVRIVNSAVYHAGKNKIAHAVSAGKWNGCHEALRNQIRHHCIIAVRENNSQCLCL